MVKVKKFYFDLTTLLLILVFLVLIIFININLNNSFSKNQSKTYLRSVDLKQHLITNQSFTNSNLHNLTHNFFYLKINNLFVPINFVNKDKSILNNAIYEKYKNSLILILNPLTHNNNNIIIQIPRNIIDSKTSDNKDNKFTVLIDNKPSKFLEIIHKNESY
ncbi:MAG: hypothetical protein ABJB73_11135, partial [Candidatus Nitrosocosmicus sp.]